MSPPLREKTLASFYPLNRKNRSNQKICKNELSYSAMAGSVINKHVSSGTQGEEEKEEEEDSAMAKVKLEKEEETGLLVTCGFQKRKRLSRGGISRRFSEQREISLEGQKNKQPRLATTRWNTERIKFAEQTLADVMKEKGASFETPVSRLQLRITARKKIGDTGLLDHSLKHIDGKVTPGGVDRFRRCYNIDGTMEYWLECADLVKISPSWWKIQTASHESSDISSKLLLGEIEKMKSDIKEIASKQKLPNHADSTEKLYKDFMNWRVKTDKQFVEISGLLTSTQCMLNELSSWKDKVEKQLVGISNSLNNLQANGSTSFSPAPESWEHILKSANLDDFTENGFEPWDDLIDGLPEPVRPVTYSLPPNPCKSTLQENTWVEEQALVKIEMQTVSCMTRGESRSSNQDKTVMTPGSTMTAGPKSDIDDLTILSQGTLKALVTWKAKAEQQLTDISNAVLALKGQNQPNWRYL